MPIRLILPILLLATLMPPAGASTFTASDGSRSARVDFSVDNNTGIITIRLYNTSALDSLVPIDILTGVFFDIQGNPTLTPQTASMDGSCLLYNSTCTTPSSSNVGGEWAYKSGALTGLTQTYGISSAGLGIFSKNDLFGGLNLSGPDDPDGLQYGITSAGDNPATNNGGLDVPLIQSAVTFTLKFSGLLSDTAISNIRFQYGTALTEPSIPGEVNEIPEPGTFVLLGGALCGLAVIARRRLR